MRRILRRGVNPVLCFSLATHVRISFLLTTLIACSALPATAMTQSPAWSQLLDKTLPVGASIAVAPSNPTILYVGGGNDGILKSTDGGLTWTLLSNGMVAGRKAILSIAVDPTNSDVVYAGFGCDVTVFCGGVYKTIDGGLNWTLAATGLNSAPVYAIAIDSSTPSTVYVGSDLQSTWRDF